MSRRSKLALVVALLLPLAVAGCSASDLPDAQLARAPADGVEIDAGPIRVLNAMVVAPEDGTDGVLTMTIANRGAEPDQLTAVDVEGSTVEFEGPQSLDPYGTVAFGANDGPVITIRNLQSRPGEAVDVALTFQNEGAVRFRTIVVPAKDEYASITPSPAATITPQAPPEASPDASPEAAAEATPSPTGS